MVIPENALIIASLAAPVVALLLLRINAALVFLSLCLGYVLVSFVANDSSDSFLRFIWPEGTPLSMVSVRLAILLAPVLLTSLIMLFSVHGRLRNIANVVPALGVSVLGALLAIPLCTPGVQRAVQALPLWQELIQAQALIIGASSIASLVFLWSQRHTAKKHGHE